MIGAVRPSVVIAHADRFVAHSLASFLDSHNFDVVCEIDDPKKLHDIVWDETPDLCIIGYHKHAGRFEADCAVVRACLPETRAVMIDSGNSSTHMQAAREQGLAAYLSLRLTPELILDGLKLVLAGHECFPSDASSNKAGLHAEDVHFTAREQDVLRLVADGLANKVIARKLDISESTVKAHMNSVLRKIGVSNRTQVACWAVGHGYSGSEPAPASGPMP